MRHARHYTLEEANAAIAWVGDALVRLREARDGLSDEEARDALAEAGPQNGGGSPGRVVSEAFIELRDTLARLQEAEVVLRDLERGLVDFPSVRDGREVYLCWLEQEPEIGYWHDLEAGFDGREPL